MTKAPLSPEDSEPTLPPARAFDPLSPEPAGQPASRSNPRPQETFLEIGGEPPTEVPGEFREVIGGWPDPAWDRYRCIKLQGAGGMGRVFRAWDPRLKRHVAVKILQGDDPDQTTRFVREARAQARIEHPNICKVYEVGEVAGRPYIAMQFIDGPTIGQAVHQLTREQKILCLRQAAEALHAAHRAGMVHRDVKPANIMLEADEDGSWHPYIVDFGLVREAGNEMLTVSGATLGTPSFMSPEQASGSLGRLARRSDVYGLGATLYTLLAGRAPFEGGSPVEILMRLLRDEAVPLRRLVPDLPADLETIVMKCLEKDPSQRYDSAKDLAEDLGRFLDGDTIMARPSGLPARLLKKARKNKALVLLGGLSLLVTLVLLGLWWRTAWESGRRAELAQRFGQKVEQLESVLWKDRSLPLHDVRPTRRLIRQRLESIEREMAQLGRLAEGPGRSALGRGYLALNDLEAARRHLETAWAGGYRPPEAAYALGLLLGHLYYQELQNLKRLESPAVREAIRKQAERGFRDPALRYLRLSAGHDAADPAYVEGLIALYENRLGEAVDKARQALARVPWLYEASLLEGDARRIQATGYLVADRPEEARRARDQADEAYRRAARTAESHDVVYQQLALLWQEYLDHQVWYRDRWDPEAMTKTLEALREARTVEPDSFRARQILAALYLSQSEYQIRHGEDAGPAVTSVLALADEMLRLRPGDPRARSTRASALWNRGKLLMIRGQDCQPALLEASDEIERALAQVPDDFDKLSVAANIYLELGNNTYYRGENPEPYLQRGCRGFERLSRLDPEEIANHVNIGMCHEIATLYWKSRESPKVEQSAARAREALDRAIRINPKFFLAHRVRGEVLVTLGEFQRLAGLDPIPALEAGRRSFQNARTLNPADITTGWRLADVLIQLRRGRIEQGRSQEDLLVEYQALVETLRKQGLDSRTREYLAQIELFLEANDAEKSGRSPQAALTELQRSLQRVLAASGDDQVVLADLGEVYLIGARWRSVHGLDPSVEVRTGLATLGRLSSTAADKTEVLGFRGELLLIGAGAENNPERRRAMATQAAAVFERLVGRFPALAEKYGPRLAQARELEKMSQQP